MSDLGARFRELRLRKGLTSTALARPRYSVSFVSQIERGDRRPSADALRYFARRLGVTPEFLWTGIPDDLPLQLRYEAEQAERDIAQDRLTDAEGKARRVVEEAERYELGELRGMALTVLGEALYRQARYAEAVETFEKARPLELGCTGRVGATAGLARSSRALGDLHYAAQVIEDFLETEGEPRLTSDTVAEMQSILVSIYFEGGDLHRAERAAARALAGINKHTPPKTEAEAYWHASRVMAERRRWEEALEMASRARFLLERLQSRREVARLHTAYASLCLEMEPPRADEAEANLDRAETLLTDLNMPAELGSIHVQRGRVSYLRGRFEEAIEHADRAAETEGAEDLVRAYALFGRGRALARLGRLDGARRAFRQAASMFEGHGAKREMARSLREVGDLDAGQGSWRKAAQSYRSAHDALESLTLRI